MIKVRGPTGTIIQFPDGTPATTINQVMAAHHDAVVSATPRPGRTPGATDAAFNGFTLNHGADVMAAGQAAKVGIENLIGRGPGYGMRQAFEANRLVKQAQMDAHANAKPGADFIENLAGGAVSPVSAATGEWGAGAATLPQAVARAGLIGGGEGYVAGGPQGAEAGALLAPLVPVGGAVAQRAAKAGGGIIGSMRRAAGMVPAATVAQQRLSTALAKDIKAGVNPAANLANWRGVSSPTLADAGGENVRALVRDAGTSGPARTTLAQYQKKTAADLQDHALALTAKLTPADARTAPEVLAAARQKIAAATVAPTSVQPGQGGALLSQALNERAAASRTAVDQAYAAARATDPKAAHVESAALPQIAANLRESVADFHPDEIPSVTKILDGIDKLSTPTVRDLFEARQQLSSLRGVPTVQARAAGGATRALDGQITTAMDQGQITGDPQVVDAWRTAIAARRAHGQQFEGDDLIHALTGQELHGEGRVVAIAPEDASNAILGRGGVAPRANLARDMSRITDFLGSDHPAVTTLQQEAAERLLQPGAGTEDFGGKLLAFAKANPDLAPVLLPKGIVPKVTAAQRAVAEATADNGAVGLGQRVLNASPSQYASDLSDLPRLPLAQVGARTALSDAIGAPTEGATGVLNRVSTATNPGLNLDATFGPEAAGGYRDALSNEVDRMQNANWVAPQIGSKTFSSTQDSGHGLLGGIHGLIGGAFKRILGGAPLSDAERMAIVNPAIGDLSPDLLTALMKPRPSLPIQAASGYLMGPVGAATGASIGS